MNNIPEEEVLEAILSHIRISEYRIAGDNSYSRDRGRSKSRERSFSRNNSYNRRNDHFAKDCPTSKDEREIEQIHNKYSI